jgi:hypothetical protein
MVAAETPKETEMPTRIHDTFCSSGSPWQSWAKLRADASNLLGGLEGSQEIFSSGSF